MNTLPVLLRLNHLPIPIPREWNWLRDECTRHLPQFLNCALDRSRDAILAGNTFDPMSRVDILDQNNLIASGSSLAGNNGSPGKEELPNLVVH